MKSFIKHIIIVNIVVFLSLTAISQNTALHFDSLNTHVQTTYPGIPGGSGARTIEAWIKTTSNHVPAAGGKQGVIADYGTFVTGGRFTFNVLFNNAIRIEVGGNGLSGTISINDGNWHHVAAVYNPAATNKYSLYVDSVLDVSGNLTVTTNSGSGTNLRIGRRIDGSGGFRGSIDEVRFYNYARTLAQIGGERNDEYCTLPSGLVAYYNFNEGVAGGTNTGITSVYDFVSGNNGSFTGFPLTGTTRNYVSGPLLTPGISISSNSATTCGTYTLPSGTIVTSSGIYYDSLTSGAGCDSLLAFNITISNSHILSANSYSSCDSYTMPNGTIITTSGVYYDTLSTTGTCDTVDEYTITILPGVNNAVTISGTTLTSTDTWASHQWLDCNNGFSVISGETSRIYNPTTTGSYACIVSRGTCSDTSACTTVTINNAGINENLNDLYKVYPNPVKNSLLISYNTSDLRIQTVSILI